MGSSSREEIVEVFDALDADLNRVCELSFDVFTTPERLRALERLERAARRLLPIRHTRHRAEPLWELPTSARQFSCR